MFEYLRIRESFATMFFIIWGMMIKLGSFVIILMVVLLAFTTLDFVAFGSARSRSQTFMTSLISRFQGSLGDVDFESAASMDRGWGIFVLIFFIAIAVLLLLNLLIAVMSEAYEEVKEVAEARWAYVQMEMLLETQEANAEKESRSGGCCGGRGNIKVIPTRTNDRNDMDTMVEEDTPTNDRYDMDAIDEDEEDVETAEETTLAKKKKEKEQAAKRQRQQHFKTEQAEGKQKEVALRVKREAGVLSSRLTQEMASKARAVRVLAVDDDY